MTVLKRPAANISQRLFVELGTSLLLESMQLSEAVSGELIGMKVGHYLIVRVPESVMQRKPPGEGTDFSVKYSCGGGIFGFTSQLIRVLDRPDYLLFLDYPESVRSIDIRSQSRVDCFLPVTVDPADRRLPGVVTNINHHGCLCIVEEASGQALSPGQTLTLLFHYGEIEALPVPGTVRSIRSDGEHIRAGLEFDGIDGVARTILTTLVPELSMLL